MINDPWVAFVVPVRVFRDEKKRAKLIEKLSPSVPCEKMLEHVENAGLFFIGFRFNSLDDCRNYFYSLPTKLQTYRYHGNRGFGGWNAV